MGMLRWIWAYLFDCVHCHTTWPREDKFGHAYVCCTDCGREMPYSIEYMQIIRPDRERTLSDSRFPATASLIIAGTLLLLTPSSAVAGIAQPSVVQSHAAHYDSIRPTLLTGWAPAHDSSLC